MQKGEQAYITQSLGGSYTVVVNGNMFRIEARTPTRLGMEARSQARAAPARPGHPGAAGKADLGGAQACYDPEIPVNIVDLGLIYDCHITPAGENSFKADVKMTLTAPGCGMGPMLAQDVQNKLLSLEAD